jgi:L-Lysine epsilon oxidase N-terminal/L-lysine epsilon oxidase C-terminal domain
MASTFEIHPAIGIARVGTSAASFVGPEPGVPAPATYRDAQGNLLRQAARFRVFRCTRAADGTLRTATEVTAADAKVEWTVHLVNGKGAAEEFPPVAARRSAAAGSPRLRNARHTDRGALVVDPGPRTVSTPGERATFDSGTFLGTAVPLGDITCDDGGALVVAGGFGKSGFVSPDGSRVPIRNFANNDNWFDDASDGTITAKVTVGTRKPVDAKPARVIVAPPDFAPGIVNLITLYDVAFQAAVDRGWRSVPAKPSFARDVQPILLRVLGYQWVLQLARDGHSSGTGMGDFASQWLALGDPSSAHAGARQGVLATLRDPQEAVTDDDFGFMPRLHHSDYAAFPNAVLRLTPTQYAVLQHWVDGHFVKDLDRPKAVKELLPDALDRVALQACSGGPFFPGIEVGRIMADPQTYSEPFRVDAALPAGRLTAGNAVPWQADFLACSVDEQSQLAWWPAQRPYQVFPSTTAEITRFWDRGVSGFAGMIDQWHRLGVVVEAQAADGTAMFAESERTLPG